MAKKMSKRKAKRLRKQGDLCAPMPKVGYGPIKYSGAGKHENKKRKTLKRIMREEIR